MRNLFRVLAVMLMLLSFGSAASADPVPQTLPMTFKTTLTADKSYSFTFSLFDAAVGGTVVWVEAPPAKLKVSGSKTIKWTLGSLTPFTDGIGGPVDFSQQLWAEARSGTKAFPRVKLAIVPYALWSATGAKGDKGDPGPPGPSQGLNCWDLNSNGVCNLASEDLSHDGVCSVEDCRIQGCTGECVPVILSGADYSFENIATSNFSHAVLAGALFDGATASAVNFSYTNLSGASFDSANASASNFSNANLTGVDFSHTNLAGATFTGAVVTGIVYDYGTICPDGVQTSNNGTDPYSCKGHGVGL